jgi:WD40-like Beta Propeller Repeat
VAGLTASACGDHGPGTGPGASSLRLVYGDGVTDTVLSKPAQALVVEVRGENGAPAEGTVVRFQPLPIDSANPYSLSVFVAPLTSPNFLGFVADSADTRGRASVLIELGTQAGAGKLLVSAPEFGLQDTARFTVLPGRAAHVMVQPRDTALYVGRAFQSRAAVTDRFGNRRPDPVSYAPIGSGVTVTPAGTITAGTSFVRARFKASAGSFTDTGWVSVVPVGTVAAVQTTTFAGHDPGLVVFDLDGSGYQWVGPGANSYGGAPAWSPSGTKLAFGWSSGSNNWLYTSDLSGNEQPLLAPGDSGLTIVSWPAYSPDGASIYFSGTTTDNFALWRASATGADPRRLYADPSGLAWRPSPSSDGTRLAITIGNPSYVCVYTLASGTVSSWAVPGHMPRWSPVAETIAFVQQYGGPVSVVSSDGTGVRQVTPVGRLYEEESLTWSSDGVWLVARASGTLELINVATGATLPLGYATAFAEPAWKP